MFWKLGRVIITGGGVTFYDPPPHFSHGNRTVGGEVGYFKYKTDTYSVSEFLILFGNCGPERKDFNGRKRGRYTWICSLHFEFKYYKTCSAPTSSVSLPSASTSNDHSYSYLPASSTSTTTSSDHEYNSPRTDDKSMTNEHNLQVQISDLSHKCEILQKANEQLVKENVKLESEVWNKQ